MTSRRPPRLTEFDEMPGLFDGLDIDIMRPDIGGEKVVVTDDATDMQSLRRRAAAAPPDSTLSQLAMGQPSATETLMFISFGSGSSGNCYYVGNGQRGLLIDAGVDPERVREGFKANGLEWKGLDGILLTHDHADHVRYAYSILRKTQLPLFCTPRTMKGLLRRHAIPQRIKDYHRSIYKEFPFKVGPLEVTAFEVSHDGTDNVGYQIQYGPLHKLVLVTDTGRITERADHYIRQARYLILESNYDAEMLAHGPYPDYLKARIASASGHMDNAVSAAYVAAVRTPRLTHLMLCHLSQDNNNPATALGTMRDVLTRAGIPLTEKPNISPASDCQTGAFPLFLAALPRTAPSPLYLFREQCISSEPE